MNTFQALAPIFVIKIHFLTNTLISMKIKKKLLKKIFILLFLLNLGTIILGVSYYFATTNNAHLSVEKLNVSSATNYTLFDTNNNKIVIDNSKNVCYDQLQQHTIDAFVSIEDKRFFEHHGVDYIRILGAIKNNILHPKQKQGASTISQQVIKNTHLSQEKTIDRKLKEIKLALELEKQYSKSQIMEIYLSSIYFGNGCYGINNASEYYFGKDSSELSIAESALLASTINAPSIYDPVNHPDKANARKELVLNLMKKSKKITQKEFNEAIKENIGIIKKSKKVANNYLKYAISEACNKLHVTETQLSSMNVKIYTYFDDDIQSKLEQELTNLTIKNGKYASIVLNNKTKGVSAIASSKGFDALSTKRQPGSLIKPILVYAPAFECGKYSPATFVSDTPVEYNDYSPENANKAYLGDVTVRTAIEKSLNIPAVKILDDIGINYAKAYAKNMGITFDKQDNNLALALGGFTQGLSLKQLSDAYMCFANSGKYEQSAFVDKIESDNQILYSRLHTNNQAVSAPTCYLINTCLNSATKNGTSKRINTNFPVCSKTGTVGNEKGNTDAYNCAYTTNHTICTWIGTNNNNIYLASSVNGATYPTQINGKVLNQIYNNNVPSNFEMPPEIEILKLNDESLKNGKVIADNIGPSEEYFNKKFLPEYAAAENQFLIEIFNFENQKPIIKFDAKRAKYYSIYRKNGSNLQFLQKIEYYNGIVQYVDLTANTGTLYEYYVLENDLVSSRESNHIKLISA